jgi:hypothetical protein
LLLVSLLVGLHIVEGLHQLFKVNIVVGVVTVVVVAVGLAIALAISCVHHLMVW